MARRTARRKPGNTRATKKNTSSADETENTPSVQADHQSVAIGGIKIDGDLSGEVNIAAGNLYKGYTAQQVALLLTQITTRYQRKPFDGRCPYKGLEVFREEDAEFFFGREKLVEDLLTRLKGSRTVFITGPSGSGKSSLIRAGLIHALKIGGLKSLRSERWLYGTMKPGRDPLLELGRVTAGIAGALSATEDICTKGLVDASILAQWYEIALKDDRRKRVVLFIDQFEEIFTQTAREAERLAFLNLLTYAATVENGRVLLLFAMRSDFVSNCAAYPELNALLNQQFIQIGAMQPYELVNAIALPALQVDLQIGPDLIAQIINDMQDEPGALPLMQFALKDLFDSQQEQGNLIALTLDNYLQRGGIHKSLERHADDSFSRLNEHDQELARSIFSGLIEIGRGTQDTGRTAVFDELIPVNVEVTDVEAVVQKLADARLIITDEQAGKDTVTLAHEKLIDAWPWLRKLVNDNREVIALQNEIISDAQEWDEHDQDISYLYRGTRLVNTYEHLEARKLVLSGRPYDFVQASIDVFNEEIDITNLEQLRKKRSQRQITLGLINVIAIILGLLVFALIQLDILRAQSLSSQAQAAFAEQKYNLALLYAYQSNRIHKNDAADFVLSQIINKNFAEGRQFAGHTRSVTSVAWSAEGQLASGSWDHTVILWDLKTRQAAQRLEGHTAEVTSLAWSTDGRLASGSGDHTIIIWNLKTGTPAKTIKGLTSGVTSLAWSTDGQLASGLEDGTVIIWDLKTGTPALTLREHTSSVESVAWSTDGRLASGSWDNTVIVWDLKSGQPTHILEGHTAVVTGVAWSADGQLASGSRDNTVILWDLKTGEPAQTLEGHSSSITSLAWSADGQLASGSWDNTVILWDLKSGEPAQTLEAHTALVSSVAWSPYGQLASGSWDSTVMVWDFKTGQSMQRLKGHSQAVTSLAWSANGRLASGSKDQTVIIWDLQTGEPKALKRQTASIESVAWSAGGRLASGLADGRVLTWDLKTGTPAQTLYPPISSIGGYTAIAKSVAWSVDGRLASGFANGTIIIWNLKTNLPAQTLRGHTAVVNSVAWSKDGRLASGSGDGTVIIWNLKTGTPAQTLRGHTADVTSVAWSADGRLASGSWDHNVILWDPKTGEPAQTFKGHTAEVTSVAWSADGQLASGSNDQTVMIWDLKTGAPAQTLKVHTGVVSSLAWSTDGQLASGSRDKLIKIARVYLASDPCSNIARNMTVSEWLQSPGAFYVYQPACPNLPVPITDPMKVIIFRRNALDSLGYILITWQGRMISLGVLLMLSLILRGIYWLIYQSMLYDFTEQEA